MNSEMMRIVDAIARDKNIDKESVLLDLEMAMVSAIRKAYGQERDAVVTIDRITGAFRRRSTARLSPWPTWAASRRKPPSR